MLSTDFNNYFYFDCISSWGKPTYFMFFKNLNAYIEAGDY